MPETLVAIYSKTAKCFVGMNTGTSCSNSFKQGGFGQVDCTSTSIGACETFILENNSDGTVSFQSTAYPNCYLHMSECGEFVNCQYGKSSEEKFKLKHIRTVGGYEGVVTIESAQFPGKLYSTEGYPFVQILTVGAR